MTHDLPLLSMIAYGLGLAFLCGMVALRLRLPLIIGYLFAGILLGPHTPGYVGNIAIVEQLAEIGVVLLMFGVGLHFSVRDLLHVKNIAIPGAVVQIAFAMALSAAVAYFFWGWSLISGLMFGLSLSVASTVVLLRALKEHHMLNTDNGHIAVGWLIVEDLAMILALVMIPTLSNAAQFSGAEAATSIAIAIGKVLLFIAFMLVFGRRILAMMFHMATASKSRELFTVAVIAAAIGISYGAAVLFGVSFALGAFFAGMMIRESAHNQAVAARALPFQDAFAVLFFVSIGILFDPMVIIYRPWEVLITAAIIVMGKSVAAFMIVWLFKHPVRTGLIISASLAQVGEFSFILVALCIAEGLLPEAARDLVLAGAIISIAINPLLFYLLRDPKKEAEKDGDKPHEQSPPHRLPS